MAPDEQQSTSQRGSTVCTVWACSVYCTVPSCLLENQYAKDHTHTVNKLHIIKLHVHCLLLLVYYWTINVLRRSRSILEEKLQNYVCQETSPESEKYMNNEMWWFFYKKEAEIISESFRAQWQTQLREKSPSYQANFYLILHSERPVFLNK